VIIARHIVGEGHRNGHTTKTAAPEAAQVDLLKQQIQVAVRRLRALGVDPVEALTDVLLGDAAAPTPASVLTDPMPQANGLASELAAINNSFSYANTGLASALQNSLDAGLVPGELRWTIESLCRSDVRSGPPNDLLPPASRSGVPSTSGLAGLAGVYGATIFGAVDEAAPHIALESRESGLSSNIGAAQQILWDTFTESVEAFDREMYAQRWEDVDTRLAGFDRETRMLAKLRVAHLCGWNRDASSLVTLLERMSDTRTGVPSSDPQVRDAVFQGLSEQFAEDDDFKVSVLDEVEKRLNEDPTNARRHVWHALTGDWISKT
jgi:hypothetical protein